MEAIRKLSDAVLAEAVKEYFEKETTKEKQRVIIKDLHSNWMDFFTDGKSILVAEALVRNHEEIKRKLEGIENA